MGMMFLDERGVPPGEVITDAPPKGGREGGAVLRCTSVGGGRREAHIMRDFFGSNRLCSPEKNFRPKEVSRPFSIWVIDWTKWIKASDWSRLKRSEWIFWHENCWGIILGNNGQLSWEFGNRELEKHNVLLPRREGGRKLGLGVWPHTQT